MTVKDRIKVFITSVRMTNQRFEVECGLSNGYIANIRKGIGENALERISNRFPDLNRVWLLTGEGDMLLNKEVHTSKDDAATWVLLLPVTAQGGSLNDFVVSAKENECEKVISPIRGVDFAITVSGDSMAPEYPNGCRIFIKKINERAFIEWGKVYVLDTCNGTVIKILVPAEREGYVKCVSINQDPIFAPFEVAFEDIYGMYKVMICLSVK